MIRFEIHWEDIILLARQPSAPALWVRLQIQTFYEPYGLCLVDFHDLRSWYQIFYAASSPGTLGTKNYTKIWPREAYRKFQSAGKADERSRDFIIEKLRTHGNQPDAWCFRRMRLKGAEPEGSIGRMQGRQVDLSMMLARLCDADAPRNGACKNQKTCFGILCHEDSRLW